MKATSRPALYALPLLGLLLLSPPAHAAGADADADGIPDTSETLLGTDPLNADTDGDGLGDLQDPAPVSLDDPIPRTGKTPPFAIKEALVENNYDFVARKDATDHFELTVASSAATDIQGFSIYVTVRDADSGASESYFKPLPGFVLPAGGEARLHLDDGTAPGHFRDNPNGIYRTTASAKVVSFELAAAGFAPVKVEVQKDKGGAEAAD